MLSRAFAATALCGLPAAYLARNGSTVKLAEASTGVRSFASRSVQVEALKNPNEQFDLLIIGGGITGSGCALEAQTRGMKVALVEREDFASETSSRSTKLIHGGVRYLEKAVKQLDYHQYKLVKEALHERHRLLANAPHITDWLPIMLPLRKWWQVPYMWAGCFCYDLVAGFPEKRCYFIGKKKAMKMFPQLDQTKKLYGCMVYHDGQMDDARVCMSVAMTAAEHGAVMANYTEAKELIKDDEGNVVGAVMVDRRTGDEFEVKAKKVLNATGPFTDAIRKMENEKTEGIVQPSSGTHVILPGYLCPEKMGLLDAKTSDGRVMFYLPWEGSTLVGTTDDPCNPTFHIKSQEKEVEWILQECRKHIDPEIKLERKDVKAAWCGIRPLVRDPSKANTQEVCRDHIVHTGENGMVTISGGKWTTYRSMAEHAVDVVQEEMGVAKDKSVTVKMPLHGAKDYKAFENVCLKQKYDLDLDICNHLAHSYGTVAYDVAEIAEKDGLSARLHKDHPFIEAEVKQALREFAVTPADVLARRMRLAFLDTEAALAALPRVVEIMKTECKWSSSEAAKEMKAAEEYINGLNLPKSA
eukprot:TRINITY_DN8197_c0_g2_i1.p1 TRINITY_DN8197_c0_g2~~TRINITY_DN8197_c0_g2_i1.p1  ORF type:complete len:584 (+),score=199.59 TRINITY_DN8197_c0_g2_i1:22-1773(+)